MPSLQEILKDNDSKMKKALEFLHKEVAGIRTGKASAALVDGIVVDYYGTPTPVKSLASISIPDPRMIVLTPWDPSALQAVSKAITGANIGINPVVDGKSIRLPVPELSEERRRDLLKVVKKKVEESKVALRNVRRDMNELAKKMEKDKVITEDEKFEAEKKIQEQTDKHIKETDELYKHKEKEILEL